MTIDELLTHLYEEHGIDHDVAFEVIGGKIGSEGPYPEQAYARGFHDGLHGVIDADDINHALIASTRDALEGES